MWVTLKVRVEKDASLTEPELIIRTPTETPMIEQLKTTLEKQLQHQQTITVWLKESQVYVPVDDILFLESADRHIIAHTIDDMYTTHDHLYELEQSLPKQFIRISKSAIVNVYQIRSITRSISTYLVTFQKTNKQVYASRRYYKTLKTHLEKMR